MNCALTKSTGHSGERRNALLPAPAKIIIVPLSGHLIIPSPFLLRLMDILSTGYSHVLKLFLFIPPRWVGPPYGGGSQHHSENSERSLIC